MKNFFISTPIYYSSGKPHIGHAYTTIMADCLARYKKLIGYNVFFVTGMDEHGQKIQDTAIKNKIDTQKMIDQNAVIFQELWKKLNIDYTYFIRTSDPRHKEFVQEKFTELYNKGYIYLDTWKSKYCVSCEENINASKIVEKDGKYFCEHGHELIDKNEESYFLKVSEFKKWIIDFFNKHPDFIVPKARVNELVNSFLTDDFSDLSISRTTFDWGIKIKENPKHVIYVWLDALFNYLSCLKIENKYDEFWNDQTEKVHLLSKEITRFHCIYWPIFLKMLDLPLPNRIISHGWIVTPQGKMSKSLGNVIDPYDLIEKFGTDVVRYYFMKEISVDRDSTFEESLLVNCYNSDLANNYGNIVSRVIGMTKKYFDNKMPKYVKTKNQLSSQFEKDIKVFIDSVEKTVNNLNINDIIKLVCDLENKINVYIENLKPWELFKENKKEELSEFINLVYSAAKLIVWYLSPILVQTTPIAQELLKFDTKTFDWKNVLNNLSNNENIELSESKILFNRI